MNVDQYKVATYDQTPLLENLEALGAFPDGISGGGVCAQLALAWLKIKLTELASEKKLTTKERVEKIKDLDTLAEAIDKHATANPLNTWKDYELNARTS